MMNPTWLSNRVVRSVTEGNVQQFPPSKAIRLLVWIPRRYVASYARVLSGVRLTPVTHSGYNQKFVRQHGEGLSMNTPIPSGSNYQRNWFVIDAADVVLGRLATKAASVLMGKHRPTYTPF